MELTAQEQKIIQELRKSRRFSVDATARANFRHRNSIMYHIEKIKKKTGYDPQTYDGMRRCLEMMEAEDPVTNGDRIRAMPDGELAAMIMGWQKTDPSVMWCRNEHCPVDLTSEDFDCTDELLSGCIVRWLQQEEET